MKDWYTPWHGAKISTDVCAFDPGGGGSTAMSTGVTNALSTKASLGHTHPQSEVTGLESSLSGLAAQVSTKAAGAHTHAQVDITGLESSLAGLAASISTKAAGSHTHAQADVTGLTSTLAALSASISTKAAGDHGHSSLAALSHTHSTTDITGLDSTLAGLAAQISTKAAGSHTHSTNDITGLASTLAGLASQISTKAAGSHTHPEGDLSLSDVTTADVSATAHGFCPKRPANSTTFLRSDGAWASPPAGGGGGGPSLVKTTVSSTINSSFSDITGLSFAVSSASAYYFEFFINWNVTISTNGAKFAVNGPASPARVNAQISISTGASGALVRGVTAYDTCVAITAAASTATWPTWIGGILVTGANAGTLQARAAPRVTSTTVVVSSASIGVLYAM